MYDFHISDMADLVAARLGLDDTAKAAVQEAIASYWSDKIAITWDIEDVRSCKKGISDDDAMAALEYVLDEHDASRGVKWDTIVDACDGDYPGDESAEDEDVIGIEADDSVEVASSPEPPIPEATPDGAPAADPDGLADEAGDRLRSPEPDPRDGNA